MAKKGGSAPVRDKSVYKAIFRMMLLQFVAVLMCLIFGTSAGIFGIDWLVYTVVGILFVVDCVFLMGEGISRGEIDDREAVARAKWNEEHPDKQEKPLKFKPWMALVYGLLSGLPFIIIGIIVFIFQNDATRPLARMAFAQFWPVMWIYPDLEQVLAPAFSLAFPLMIAIGYIIGPYKRRRDQKAIDKAIRRAKRRRKRRSGA